MRATVPHNPFRAGALAAAAIVAGGVLSLPAAFGKPPAPSSHYDPARHRHPGAVEFERRYLALWQRGDADGMWQCLSKRTKRWMPLATLRENVARSNRSYLTITHIDYVKESPESRQPDVAYVTYQAVAQIKQAEADRLRRAGHKDAKPGRWVFKPTSRRVVFEDGQWRLDIPEKPEAPSKTGARW